MARSWFAVTVLLAGLAAAAGANPIPPTAIFTHVQPPDPAFCIQAPPMACEQIVQHTEATGRLEFDLFLWSYFPGSEFHTVRLTAMWPPSWTFVEGGICAGGQGTVVAQGHRAEVSASWLPDCPRLDTGVRLIARIVLDVTDPGEFAYSYQEPHTATWGCPPDDYSEPLAALVGATAGVECAYCDENCDFELACAPHLTPTTLVVDLPAGQSGVYDIEALVPMWEHPCPVEFLVTESWMALEVEPIDPVTYRLALTVDTSGLPAGEYAGWVRAASECVDCCRVTLTVSGSQGIEDEPGPGPPTTWGALKTLYR
jgi:hypothetical protein